MGKTAINVRSVTYAMKGQQILERRGIFSHIKKSKINREGLGCGYSIVVSDSQLDNAIYILNSYKIQIVSIDRLG